MQMCYPVALQSAEFLFLRDRTQSRDAIYKLLAIHLHMIGRELEQQLRKDRAGGRL